MWICLNDAFISAVQNRDNHDELMVRARKKTHLANVFPNRKKEIFSVDESDYAWRIVVSKTDFTDMLSNRVNDISYDNFKNSVKDTALKKMYNEVWWLGLIMQEGRKWVKEHFGY